MHRFFVPPAVVAREDVELSAEVAHQMATVLRLRVKEQVLLLDNLGAEYVVELTSLSPKQVRGHILAQRPAAGEPPLPLTLFQCLLKKDKFEWVLQKGTEIGVSDFIPVLSERTIPEVTKTKNERWERILTEAAEQSGRGRIPVLHPPIPLAEAYQRMATYSLALLPWEAEPDQSLTALLQQVNPATLQNLAVCIGPEGGFAPAEVDMASQAGLKVVTLGKRILRAETAALYVTAVLAHHFF